MGRISTDLILGLDFMTCHACVIDVPKRQMKIGGTRINCETAGEFGCRRVPLAETTTIPPGTEVLLTGRVNGGRAIESALVENAEQLTEKSVILVESTTRQRGPD